MARFRPRSRRVTSAALFALMMIAASNAAFAADKKAADKPETKEAANGSAAKAAAVATPGGDFSVDMIVHAQGKTMTMKRTVSGTKTRMDMEAEGHSMSSITLGDEAGTTYTLMHEQKQGMKQSMKAMQKGLPKTEAPRTEDAEKTPAKMPDYVGQETIDGKTADKYKLDANGSEGFMWIESGTNLPLRMEAGGSQVDFKNYDFGPKPAALFEPPKNYKVQDMDEMMAKAGMSGGMGGMAGMMAGGMAKGMAGSMAGSYAGTLGGGIGSALGGPIGGMIGTYVGQKIGQKIGSAAAGAVLPGK